MAFRFNFAVDDCGGDSVEITCADDSSKPKSHGDTIHQVTCDIHKIQEPDVNKALQLCLSDGSVLLYSDVRHLSNHDDDVNSDKTTSCDVVTQAEVCHSDLIAGVYEGGLKIWECSIDLTEYLVSLQRDFNDLRVLELGCGAALPSLYVGLKGADVSLQDYNRDVIEQVTLPNMLLNCQESKIKYELFAGDWSNIGDLLMEGSNRFDLILTSETIYNVESYKSLHDIMKQLLKPSGDVFVAAKTHYFGVGGGTDLFKEFVLKKGVFDITTVKHFNEGVKREILHMTFRGQRSEMTE